MADMFTVCGFEESTYVRTVRMVLAEKGAEYGLVPVNIMEREGAQPEHLARHPFGKTPVLDHGDLRLFETGAITRYLNDTLPGKSLVPGNVNDRARTDIAAGIHNSYGYSALIGLAARHLFPDSSAARTRRCGSTAWRKATWFWPRS